MLRLRVTKLEKSGPKSNLTFWAMKRWMTGPSLALSWNCSTSMFTRPGAAMLSTATAAALGKDDDVV